MERETKFICETTPEDHAAEVSAWMQDGWRIWLDDSLRRYRTTD